MAGTYSIADARAQLPTLVDRASGGAEITITRRGQPVAVLVPLHKRRAERSSGRTFSERYDAFLRRHSLEKEGLEEEFVEGLRDRSSGRKVRL